MSLVLVDRRTVRAASRVVLRTRVAYISAPNHPDHSGAKKKTIYPARNYNVPYGDQSPEAFMAALNRLIEDYFRCRRGKRGKSSRRLFEEIIYSTMVGVWLTAEEREEIEKRIIRRFGAMAVCRTAWHVDEKTGRCDLHILISAINLDYPPAVTLWSEFGGTDRDHLYSVMDKLDVEIARYLNRRPERQKAKLKSAKRRHREAAAEVIGKQPQLGDELARFFFDRKKPTEIDEAAITEAIRALDHKVKKITRRSVPVVFRGRKKPRRYNFANLVDGVVVELERLNGTRAGSGSESGDFAANMQTEITPS